jgi:hypothetical protein
MSSLPLQHVKQQNQQLFDNPENTPVVSPLPNLLLQRNPQHTKRLSLLPNTTFGLRQSKDRFSSLARQNHQNAPLSPFTLRYSRKTPHKSTLSSHNSAPPSIFAIWVLSNASLAWTLFVHIYTPSTSPIAITLNVFSVNSTWKLAILQEHLSSQLYQQKQHLAINPPMRLCAQGTAIHLLSRTGPWHPLLFPVSSEGLIVFRTLRIR